jgi:hypothetical protein
VVEAVAGEVAVAVAEVAVEVAVVAVDTSPRPLGNWKLTRSQDGPEATAIPFATADGDQLHHSFPLYESIRTGLVSPLSCS